MNRLATRLTALILCFAATHCGDDDPNAPGDSGDSGDSGMAGASGDAAGGTSVGAAGAAGDDSGSAQAGAGGTATPSGGASSAGSSSSAGSDHGGESAGGTPGAAGSSAGAGGQGDLVIPPECAELWAAVSESDADAKTCDPEEEMHCVIVEDAGICGCDVIVTDPESEAAMQHLQAIAALNAAGCHPCDSPCAGGPIGDCFDGPSSATCL